jgi:50S ribosomal subunit-associated GTPase HflX
VLNKVDLLGDRGVLTPALREFERRGAEVRILSGVTGEGLEALLQSVMRTLDEVDARNSEQRECGT